MNHRLSFRRLIGAVTQAHQKNTYDSRLERSISILDREMASLAHAADSDMRTLGSPSGTQVLRDYSGTFTALTTDLAKFIGTCVAPHSRSVNQLICLEADLKVLVDELREQPTLRPADRWTIILASLFRDTGQLVVHRTFRKELRDARPHCLYSMQFARDVMRNRYPGTAMKTPVEAEILKALTRSVMSCIATHHSPAPLTTPLAEAVRGLATRSDAYRHAMYQSPNQLKQDGIALRETASRANPRKDPFLATLAMLAELALQGSTFR